MTGLYWWHPVVWWVRRPPREAEEQCCDAWVVWAMPERARTYAAALLAAVEFVSGAPTAPAVASATSGRACFLLEEEIEHDRAGQNPKGLSWAGRFAVVGIAALALPLAPSWAQDDKPPSAESDRPTLLNAKRDADKKNSNVEQLAGVQLLDRIKEEFRRDSDVLALKREIDETREHLDHIKGIMRQPHDLARVAAQHQYDHLVREYNELWESKYGKLLAVLAKHQDGDKQEKARDVAERFQEQLKDLVKKIGKELVRSPRKFANRSRKPWVKSTNHWKRKASRQRTLPEALEKSQRNSRSVEDGGPVNKELHDAIEKAHKDMQEAFDRARGDAKDQMEALANSRAN